jgi:hypothetical protein
MRIHRALQWIMLIVATASILFFAAFSFFKLSSRDISAAIFIAFMSGVALSPIVLWWVLTFCLKSLLGRFVLLVGTAGVFGFGVFEYYNLLVVHLGEELNKDALNILGLLFFALYQNAALVLLFGVVFMIEYLRHKHDPAKNSP